MGEEQQPTEAEVRDPAGESAADAAPEANGPEQGEQGTEDDAAAEAAGDAEGTEDDTAAEAADAPPLPTTLEAVLFASAEPVPLTRLVRVLGAWSRAAVQEGLEELRATLERERRGIRLVETAGGFQLRSAVECAPWLRRFFTEKPPRLSRAVLETLAIVAYRQPVTRGEVEAVRGVNCDAVLGALLARGLIQVVGRRQSPGRPVEYGTTTSFLELFSLRDLSELPELPEPSALARLIEEADAAPQGEGGDGDDAGEGDERDGGAGADGAPAEDPEPGRDRVAQGGGGPDPGGEGPGERPGGAGAGGESGSGPGPDHG